MKAFAAVLLLLTGCAVTLTEEEAASCDQNAECLQAALKKKLEDKQFQSEYNRGIDADNWRKCEMIYRQAGAGTVHDNHQHGPRDKIYAHEIKSDLITNQCRKLIGKEGWATHL